MRKSLCVCLVVLVGLVFFSGCGKVSQRAIIGKWEMTLRIGENVNQIRTLKLSKDGTFTRGILYQSAKESLSGPTWVGIYEFIEKDKIRFNYEEAGSEVYKFEISKDKLFLTSSNYLVGEACQRYQRVK